MSQSNIAVDNDEQHENDEAAREQMKTTHGHERRELDIADDDHPLSDMDSKREAPIESVAKNVVNRYDVDKAFIREYLANAHTACIQRAKWMLKSNGDTSDVDMSNVVAVLEAAKEQFGYEPVITVKYNQDPENRWTFKIIDNGIGIDSQTAYALRDIGLSGWHMDGSTNGQFGQGTFAGFLPVDLYGEFHMGTMSAKTGEDYRAAWKLTDLNDLDGKRGSIGTTFTWPVFSDECDIDIYDAVREYSEGLIVPVLYEEYDENGNENHNSDEFLPEYMEERYPDDAMTVTYEDEFGKVVWSPKDPEGWNENINTFCGYQPINRNESGYSLNNYKMPSAFDFRLKVEDGSIIEVNGEMDHELVGKTPVSRQKYRSMLLSERSVAPEGHVDDADKGYIAPDGLESDFIVSDRSRAQQMSDVGYMDSAEITGRWDLTPAVIAGKYAGRPIIPDDEWEAMDDGRIGDQFVPRDEIPNDLDVLQAMEPTDDRDRFERKHVQDVLRRYSEKLWNELRQKTADVFRSVDTFEDIFDLEGNEQALFHKGVSRFGPNFKRSEPETIQDELKDEIGVEIPLDVCEKIGVMKRTVSLAPRDCHRPQKKGNRQKKPVWKVIRLAQDDQKDGDVYMGWRISEQKARLAWELDDDNQVIQTTKRELFKDRLGWKDMTDLPTQKFDKHFDTDFDDSFLDKWDKDRTDDVSSSDSGGISNDVKSLSYDDKRAQKRDVTVRLSTGKPGVMKDMNGESLFEALDDANASITWKHYLVNKLILYRATEHDKGAGSRLADKNAGVFYAVVPNYVYDYLIKADDSYTEDEYLNTLTDEWVDYDWSPGPRAGRTLEAADERDVFVMGYEEDLEPFEEYDEMDRFRDKIQSSLRAKGRLDDDQEIRSITFRSSLDEYKPVMSRKGIYDLDDDEARPSVVSFTTSSGYSYPSDAKVSRKSMFYDCVLSDLDRSAPEWDRFNVSINNTELIESLRRLQDAGGFVSTDDDASLPCEDDEDYRKRRYGATEVRASDVYMTRTLERLEDAGGFVTEDDGGDN